MPRPPLTPFALATILLLAGLPGAPAAKTLVFEAEDWSTPTNAWLRDRESTNRWNLWSTDVDASNKWSGGKVLRSPKVEADRPDPEAGAPVLHTRITNIPPGFYAVLVKCSRALGISFDGKTWSNLYRSGGQLGTFEIKNGILEFDIDDRYATPSSLGTSYYDAVVLTPAAAPAMAVKRPPVAGWAKERVGERLDRGLVAQVTGTHGVYLSWRLLSDDGEAVAFNVYRRDGDGKPARINAAPITRTTDFSDLKSPAGVARAYTVRPIRNGDEGRDCTPFTIPPGSEPKGYLSFKIEGGSFQKVGLGDLDGDGVLDYVLKTPAPNVVDPWGPFWKKSPDTYKIEAYRSTGERLWKRDLGWSIEMGIWYSPYIVWDLDGDGRAEVMVKVGEGDPRNAEGKVEEGAEWCLILDGKTGAEKARIPWPTRDGFTDPYRYNFFSRNQMGIAYLDGKTPFLILARGTYNIMKAEAWSFHEGRVSNAWKWTSADEGPRAAKFTGQGAHTMACADVDGDGRDEVILGSCVLSSAGNGFWSTGMGHCDCAYLGKIDPDRPGLQIYYNYETKQVSNGQCLVDAKTGEILWGLPEPTTHVHAQAFCADIDPFHPGAECYGGERDAVKRWLHTAKGELIADEKKFDVGLYRPTLYWDATPQRVLKMGTRLQKYNGRVVNTEPIPGGDDFYVFIADLTGDWREEIVTYHQGELRVYMTDIPARDRRVTLLQDPVYRRGVAHNAMGYPQSPMTSTLFDTNRTAVTLDLSSSTFKGEKTITGTVKASLFDGKPFLGTLKLSATAWVAVDPTILELKAEAGKVAESRFSVTLKERPAFLQGTRQAVIRGELSAAGRTLPVEAAMDIEETIPMDRLLVVPGGAFAEQGGGEAKVRTPGEKPGSTGKSISHWDKQGHFIEWKVKVPVAGDYQMMVRYAGPSEIVREIRVDDRTVTQTFDGTGGFGNQAREWQFAVVREAEPVTFHLAAGEHRIRMVNADGMGMNLDFIAFALAEGKR